jgi:hypothetical protein
LREALTAAMRSGRWDRRKTRGDATNAHVAGQAAQAADVDPPAGPVRPTGPPAVVAEVVKPRRVQALDVALPDLETVGPAAIGDAPTLRETPTAHPEFPMVLPFQKRSPVANWIPLLVVGCRGWGARPTW